MKFSLKKYGCHPPSRRARKILTQTDFKNFVREKDKSGFETADNTWEEFYNSIGFKKKQLLLSQCYSKNGMRLTLPDT